MSFDWKLKAVLEQHNITVYRLANVSGIPRNTLYNLVNKEPARVDLGTFDAVLGALDELTGKRISVTDLLEREATTQDDADLAETGLGDYVATLAEIETDVPAEELKAWNEAFTQASRPTR